LLEILGIGLSNNKWGVQSMIEQIHLEKNKGNNYHGIQWDEQTQKKTWQWEVVATQAYLKNMNPLFITHGQSFGNCARIEFDDLPRQN